MFVFEFLEHTIDHSLLHSMYFDFILFWFPFFSTYYIHPITNYNYNDNNNIQIISHHTLFRTQLNSSTHHASPTHSCRAISTVEGHPYISFRIYALIKQNTKMLTFPLWNGPTPTQFTQASQTAHSCRPNTTISVFYVHHWIQNFQCTV